MIEFYQIDVFPWNLSTLCSFSRSKWCVYVGVWMAYFLWNKGEADSILFMSVFKKRSSRLKLLFVFMSSVDTNRKMNNGRNIGKKTHSNRIASRVYKCWNSMELWDEIMKSDYKSAVCAMNHNWNRIRSSS